MHSDSVPDPAHRANVEVRDPESFDRGGEGHLILLTKLYLLSSIGASTRHIEQIYPLLCQDGCIPESVMELPTFALGQPVHGGDLPEQRSGGRDVSPYRPNDLDAETGAILKTASPLIGPLV